MEITGGGACGELVSVEHFEPLGLMTGVSSKLGRGRKDHLQRNINTLQPPVFTTQHENHCSKHAYANTY